MKEYVRAAHVEKNGSLPEESELWEHILRSMADGMEKSRSSHLQHGQALVGGNTLSASWGGHNKFLQTVWLNAMEMYSHSAGDQKSKLKAGLCTLQRVFSLLLDSGGSKCSLGLQAYLCSFCLHIQMAPSSPRGFVFLCMSLIRALVPGFRAHLHNPG